MKTTKREIKLKIPFYHQTLPTSCGAACMLMIGNYLKPEEFPLTSQKEREIHEKVRFWKGNKAGELENMAKLVRFARENRFSVRYFLEGPWESPPEVDVKEWKKYLDAFFAVLRKERGKKGVTIVNRCELNDLLKEVKQGRPVLCEIKFSGFVTHCIVLRGFKGNIVYVIDPLEGYYRVLRCQLAKDIDLGYMKNALSFEVFGQGV
jgi:ABC-type bacteriocin/lantibiotic exporter with double-glycine peptidase domain